MVIENGGFVMNASITAAFDNKNTTESIFEIQQNDQNNAGIANDGMATFYASLVGIGRADVRMVSDFLIHTILMIFDSVSGTMKELAQDQVTCIALNGKHLVKISRLYDWLKCI